jgi:hypothetical protein
VGILGQGASGSGTSTPVNNQASGTVYGGNAGSGGTNGTGATYSPPNYYTVNNSGGGYGGGGAGAYNGTTGTGANGAVRIIWGTGRSFPSTLTTDQ